MSEIKVLYIDDEEHNLNAFKASFRRQYDIYTCGSAPAALEMLNHIDVNVIISDQRMPEMTGVEFFKIAKDKFPDPVRILLTGYADIEALADAINNGDIYKYITKPWNELELHNSISNAFDSYKTKKQLKEKIAELQKTNDELNRFIYSISHELRAPLASALGVINIVKIENLNHSPESGEYWNLMESCCNKLDYNITKTLQYYKNSRYQIDYERINFASIIENLVSIYKLSPDAAYVDFNINIKQPVVFFNDRFRIEIILGNLISNAIKYQKPDEKYKKVNIEVNITEFDAHIQISDNGLGILDEHLSKIFTQFFKERNQKGVGLGLFIVKEALDKIKGKIAVKSDINKGTVFTIRIPNEIRDQL